MEIFQGNLFPHFAKSTSQFPPLMDVIADYDEHTHKPSQDSNHSSIHSKPNVTILWLELIATALYTLGSSEITWHLKARRRQVLHWLFHCIRSEFFKQQLLRRIFERVSVLFPHPRKKKETPLAYFDRVSFGLYNSAPRSKEKKDPHTMIGIITTNVII